MAKVLLVEDDNNLREIYQARLLAEGYDIVAAQNGEEALVSAKQNKPDLIISDVMMPRISGFEMLDILRNTDELKNTKVIMLTALGQAEDQTRADNLGADKYLVKSQVTLEDIVNAAKELLSETTPTTTPAPDPTPAVSAPTTAPVAPAAPATPATDHIVVQPIDPLTTTPAPDPTPAVSAPTTAPEPPTPVAAPAVADDATPEMVPVEPSEAPVTPTDTTASPTPIVSEPVEPASAPAATTIPVTAPEPATTEPASIAIPTEPAAEPAPTVVAPAEAPAPEPAAADPAPAAEAVTPEPETTPDPGITAAAEAAATHAGPQSLEDEEAQLQSQIDNYANEPAEPTPEATPNEEATDAANDATMIDAVEALTSSAAEPMLATPPSQTPSPEPAAEPAPTVVAPAEAPAPEPAAADPAPVSTSEQVNVVGRKVIQPISTTDSTGPNLDELLAKEAAKEQAASAGAPAKPIIVSSDQEPPVAQTPTTPAPVATPGTTLPFEPGSPEAVAL